MSTGRSPRVATASRRRSELLLPPGLALDEVEDLFQDREAVHRSRFVGRQRRLDPEVRRVRHREQAAADALVEDPIADLAGQRGLFLLVADALARHEHARAARGADERIAID